MITDTIPVITDNCVPTHFPKIKHYTNFFDVSHESSLPQVILPQTHPKNVFGDIKMAGAGFLNTDPDDKVQLPPSTPAFQCCTAEEVDEMLPKSGGGSSGWGIAGIVMGSIAGVALIGTVIYLVSKTGKGKKGDNDDDNDSGPPSEAQSVKDDGSASDKSI